MITLEEIRAKIKPGDPIRIAERAGKSDRIVRMILQGKRKPQVWFFEHASAYLDFMGRLDKKQEE